ncbi:IS110 family transposase [Phaeovulum sp.]|uniref:IS110 family transposase n=1 Tax=Phaeovulum sp. TaxID=2934796 RepID=UPI002AB9FBF6|nr:IS110 family transposase [Phaeovulum sp.]MDZ4120216.1 IS110 family transposase [Phaeovulum sp.]
MKNIIGIDISKDRLDVFTLADGAYHQFANERHGIGALIRQLGKLDQPLVVFEATGAYHRQLESSLAQRSLHFNKINPRQSRRFAEATGRLAKTDRVDAAMLARMAAALKLSPQIPNAETHYELKELLVARRGLVKDLAHGKARAKGSLQPLVRRQITRRLRLVESQIAELEREILNRINGDSELHARFTILLSIPGISEITAFTMLIEMPELGAMSNKQAASLAGLAPVSRQSGKWQGKEHIRGGRRELRRALYMPALSAMRFNPDLKEMSQTLSAKGKPAKVVITAVMRKLIVLSNILIAAGRKWVPKTA